ncbi:MAG: hypothetical protein NXI24_18175 [bacterium]|nr:hypothetical protein [bacterium]
MEQDSTAHAVETIDAANEFRRLQDRYDSRNADEIIQRIESLENEQGIQTGQDASELAALNETIQHLHGQLESLYAEKEQLELRINASNAAGIIETFEGLEAQLALCYAEKETRAVRGLEDEFSALDSLELQLQNLYNEREILEEQYGVSGSEDIRLMLDNLNAQLVTLYQERENYVIMDGDALIIQGPRKFFIKKTDS